eukprot:5232992-Lingulodinium_polyedra.AAC.1
MIPAEREYVPSILAGADHRGEEELSYAGQAQNQVPANGTIGQGDSLPAAVQARPDGGGALGRLQSAPARHYQCGGGCMGNGWRAGARSTAADAPRALARGLQRGPYAARREACMQVGTAQR